MPGADRVAQTVPSVEVAQRLRLARALANTVVVSIHWGTNIGVYELRRVALLRNVFVWAYARSWTFPRECRVAS